MNNPYEFEEEKMTDIPGVHERGYSKGKVAEFTDRNGEKRTIHKTRHGLTVARLEDSVPMKVNAVIGPLIGKRIRNARHAAGISARELCERAGLTYGQHPKQRVAEIEDGSRRYGIRFGTLYVIAAVCGVEPQSLLPAISEVMEIAGVQKLETWSLR